VRWKQLFAHKPLHHLQGTESNLHRVIGPLGMIGIGIGAIIGSGIFVTTGQVAADNAGPAVVLSFLVAGVGCALAAFCYAEFASLAPSGGSAYSYAYATLGELLAWIIGWDLVLEYAVSGAVVASGWAAYLNELLKAVFGEEAGLSPKLLKDPFSSKGEAYLNLPAALVMIFVTVVLVRGVRHGTLTNSIMVTIKITVVVFAIIAGVQYINPANWTGISPDARLLPDDPDAPWGLLGQVGARQWFGPTDDAVRSPYIPYGLSGIIAGAAIVFFSYIGFDTVSTHSEEARRPSRDVPVGIIGSLIVCSLLYVALAAVITGMVPYPTINKDAAVAEAFARQARPGDTLFPRVATAVIAIGALAGMTSVLLVTFQGQARIFLAMARDGLLPRIPFGVIHPHFRTPHLSTIITGSLVAAVAALTPGEELLNLISIGTLLAFAIVCAAVLYLRIHEPSAHRPFRTPFVWVVAPLGIVVNVGMMLFLPVDTWLRLIAWFAIGMVVYFAFGYRHSRLHHTAPEGGRM
jgi:APA family basic amino acid/polyamine antiporter